MDNEVQYRCAGYIRAVIERYAEFLDDEADEDDNYRSDADELSGDENEETKEAKARKKHLVGTREGQIFFNFLPFRNHCLISFNLQLT